MQFRARICIRNVCMTSYAEVNGSKELFRRSSCSEMAAPKPRQTFRSPAIPFAGTILGGLLPGEMVLVQGSVLSDADRFQVDLTCGSSVEPRADVALHFNPRFRTPCVVLNALQGGHWGREQVLDQNPFRAGEPFELVILVLKDSFKVALNGAHLVVFPQRVALRRVDTLCVSGAVRVQVAAVLPSRSDVSPTASLTNQEAPKMNQEVPQTRRTSDWFEMKLRLLQLISVVPPEDSLQRHCRFDSLQMIILCEAQRFRVSVNGLHQLDYRHRVQDLNRIGQLEVQGDVRLLDLQVL
ncbi:galectin-8-like [Pseudoliparis swirei]|uniref:galectin-8-like n=1 Tax=Pseudoliparis swirei TaxID=2059687 RepID=UPI0024BEDF70|nr:galectin-8-like [Pseudoliparis swirei]